MAKPWIDSGYHVVMVDPQHDETTQAGNVTRIAGTIIEAAPALGEIIRTRNVAFVAGFPPCTDVAVSGARWWESKRAADPYFQAKASIVAEQVRMTCLLSGAPGFFENPVSAFTSIFGPPSYTFNPSDYTGLCANDNYRKKTCLWAFNGFVMPPPNRDPSLGPPNPLYIRDLSPSPDRQNIRSATPQGFAKAVFQTNAPHLRSAANDNNKPANAA